MKRLTIDQPENNTETALNLFYVKDGEAWARGGGEAPDYPDVRLTDFARRLIRSHGVEEFMEPDSDDAELGEQIHETLFDGPDTTEGLIALLYTTAWALAELREKLKQYEDAEGENRLIWAPCKVGDTIYEVDLPEYGVIVCKVLYVSYINKHWADEKDQPIVRALSVGVEVVDGHGVGSSYAFEAEDFGRSVFLTVKEAIEALDALRTRKD